MDEKEQIIQWLQDGDEQEAANLLAQCSLDYLYVDTMMELLGEDAIDLMDVNIQAPRQIIKGLDTSYKLVSEQIQGAIHECAPSMGLAVRGISWVPKLSHPDPNSSALQITAMLAKIDSEHIHKAWAKALERKNSDPEGAITVARTLVESVCKHILDKLNISYPDDADLPKLYHLTAEQLHLAPNKQSDKIFRQILGNMQAVISGLAYLRNELGDAHGKGIKEMSPDTAQAELAVNLAGTAAIFIISVWEQSRAPKP